MHPPKQGERIMNRPDIVAGIHDGIEVASERYRILSKGYRLRVEYPLVVNIAESLDGCLSESESLRYEVKFKEILRLSGAAPAPGAVRRVLRGSRRADLVLFNRVSNPICVVEVKRRWNAKACRRDIRRLHALLLNGGSNRGGSLRHGFLAVLRQGRGESLDPQIQSMTRMVETWTHDWQEGVRISSGTAQRDEFKDGWWWHTSFCVAISCA